VARKVQRAVAAHAVLVVDVRGPQLARRVERLAQRVQGARDGGPVQQRATAVVGFVAVAIAIVVGALGRTWAGP
jgi:hypothetical protein